MSEWTDADEPCPMLAAYEQAQALPLRTHGTMILLEPGMKLEPISQEREPRYRFELHGAMSIRGANGWELHGMDAVRDALAANIRAMMDVEPMPARDNRTARATFFPKAKNRKCVG